LHLFLSIHNVSSYILNHNYSTIISTIWQTDFLQLRVFRTFSQNQDFFFV
jgi:hypothetical protein